MSVTALRIVLAVAAAPQLWATLAFQSPHTPSEEELDRRLTGVKSDDQRGYQARSTETFTAKVKRFIAWVNDRLSLIKVTPSRFAVGLGLIGIVYTSGKNKKLVRWAVLSVFSYLLAIFGGAGMLFDWPFMN